MIPKKLAVINDIAGYGRCSLTTALPVISILKVQACPVPTSVFSNHTGFPDWYSHDLTDCLPDYLRKWEELKLRFDGIYCGYLGSERQIDIVSGFLEAQHMLSEPMILLDPVMGDHGKTYSGISKAHCARMKSLVRRARILTPNLTEACLLTDTPYSAAQEAVLSGSGLIREMLSALHDMGPEQIVITGILEDGQLANYISDQKNQSFSIYKTPVAGPFRHGTGDLFASIAAAECLNGRSLFAAVQKASDFIGLCIAGTQKENVPETDGVCFENYLSFLCSDS